MIFSAFLFLCAFILGTTKAFEPDTLWHIKLGEEIIRTHTLPHTVPFIFTGAEIPWVATEWLSEVLFYFLYVLGGFPALTLFNAAVLGVSSLFLFGALTSSTKNTILSLLLSLLWVFLVRGRFVERPHIFSILGLCVLLLLLSRPATRKSVYVYPLIMAVWANCHGGFVLGIALIGLTLIEDVAASWPRVSRRHKSASLALALLLSAAATLLTPYHVRLIPFVLSHAWQARMIDTTMEFRPLSRPGYYGVLLFVFLITAYYLTSTVRGIIRAGVFGALAVFSQRLVPYFLILSVPVLGDLVVVLLKYVPRDARGFFRKFPVLTALSPVLLALVLVPVSVMREGFPAWGIGLDPVYYPASAMEFVRTSGFTGNIYNSMNFSGPLILAWYPGKKVFQGSFYSEKEIHKREGLSFSEVVGKYSVTHAIVEARLRYLETGLFPRRDWALVYWDDTALVLARRIPANSRIIANNEFRIVNPENLLNQVRTDSLPPFTRKELKREVTAAPQCSLAHLALGTVYRNLKDYRDAEREYIKVTELPPGWSVAGTYLQKNPYRIMAYNYLGIIYSREGRLRDAEDSFRKAIREGPYFDEAYYNLGVLYSSEGKYDEAEKALRKSLDIEPANSWAWNNLGTVLMKKGYTDGARKAFSMALVADPYNAEARANLAQLPRK